MMSGDYVPELLIAIFFKT